MTNPKYSQEQLDQVVSLYESGVSKTEIARRMNMHKCTVGNIIQRRCADAAKGDIPAEVQAQIVALQSKIAQLSDVNSRLQNETRRADELGKQNDVLRKENEELKKAFAATLGILGC